MSLLRFCEWLAATPGSIALHESRYLYLVVLSVHVLTLCLFVGTAAMIDLRLIGMTMQRVRFSEVMERLLPWTAAGFLPPPGYPPARSRGGHSERRAIGGYYNGRGNGIGPGTTARPKGRRDDR